MASNGTNGTYALSQTHKEVRGIAVYYTPPRRGGHTAVANKMGSRCWRNRSSIPTPRWPRSW